MYAHKLYFGTRGTNDQQFTILVAEKWLAEKIRARVGNASYTTYQANGVFEGVAEATLVMEVVDPSDTLPRELKSIAQLYCHEFYQDCVLHTVQSVTAQHISW